jgi:hypothetical protein
MDPHETDPISARLHAEEERLRRRILLFTLAPAAVAVLLIALTGWQVARARDDVARFRGELVALQDSATELRDEIAYRLETLDATRREADSLNVQVAALQRWVQARNAGAVRTIESAAAEQFQAVAERARVYLHILDERQRRAATIVQKQLQEAGYSVPGIEQLEKGPSASEIRFFTSDDAAGADRLRAVLQRAGVELVIRDLTKRYATSTAIRPGQFEIWFGSDFGRT